MIHQLVNYMLLLLLLYLLRAGDVREAPTFQKLKIWCIGIWAEKYFPTKLKTLNTLIIRSTTINDEYFDAESFRCRRRLRWQRQHTQKTTRKHAIFVWIFFFSILCVRAWSFCAYRLLRFSSYSPKRLPVDADTGGITQFACHDTPSMCAEIYLHSSKNVFFFSIPANDIKSKSIVTYFRLATEAETESRPRRRRRCRQQKEQSRFSDTVHGMIKLSRMMINWFYNKMPNYVFR